MLTQRDIVPYLLRCRLLSPASVVGGEVAVWDVSRRNRNFMAVAEQGPSFLLKQGIGPDRIATVEREAAVYRLLAAAPAESEVHRFLPRFYQYDQEQHILTLEAVDGAQNVREYHTRRGRFSTLLARLMGRALGALHRLGTGATPEAPRKPFAHRPPWVLSLHHPDLSLFKEVSHANLQLIKIIQQSPVFGALLDELGRQWQTDTLIHRDIKWDNWLVFGKPDSGRATRLKLIDWELADVGDPCWDVGSVFNDYLSFWLLSIPVTGQAPPARFLELARYPLERMQPALRAFWTAYVQRMDLDAATADQWLLRAVRYSAARLAQTAFEQMQTASQLTGNIVCFLQLSLNILQRPQEALAQLLGLPLQGIRFS